MCAPVCEVENKYLLWHSVNTLTSLRALFTIEGTNLPVQTANSTRQSGLGGIAWLYWIWPPGYRYMISTYLFALTEHVHSEASFASARACLPYTNAHAHKRGANVYVAEIISPYNGKKSSKISRRPPCSSPGFILLIISSLVPLCAAHSRHKTSASREEVFINISIYCVLKGHKQHILLSSWTNSFNSARKRASFQHTQLDKHIANSARQADRGS